jgi:Antitoxin Phd_YefM, type II toxin-antitoxin system
MAKVISALTARTQLGQIIKRASEQNERFVVRRRGESQVIIMGIADYIKLAAPEPEILKLIGEESKRKGTNKLTMREIDAEIAAYRREKRLKNAAAKARA